jgi:glycosyltransferase involved in cell wall biosynthesis
MYDLRAIKTSDGFDINFSSLQERRALMQEALRKGKKIVFLLYEQQDWSTFRYRCYNVCQITQQSEAWQCIYFFKNIKEEIDFIIRNIQIATFLVCVRCQWIIDIDNIINEAKKNNIKILFDIDDYVFDINYLKMLFNTVNADFNWEGSYSYWFGYFSRLDFTASLADGFIATNALLGEKLAAKYGRHYQIIPNSLNKDQMRISDVCINEKMLVGRSSPFTLGYFSGSPSHINDFRIASREIASFLYDFPDSRLVVVGFIEFPEYFNDLISKQKVVLYELTDFIALQKYIAEVDVNLVPLVINDFTNCKSELKFFEAAAVKTPTIAAKTYTYKRCIEHGVNGFLCSPGMWYNTIRDIYEGKYNIAEIVDNAYDYSMNRYYGNSFLKSVEECYDKLLEMV